MNDNWNTSVNELFEIFRGAQLSLLPWLERAKIRWKEGESYDDWDNIVNALYESIIINNLIGELDSEHTLPKYDFEYKNYTDLDFILVKSEEHSDKSLIFISYQSKSQPLDSVKAAMMNNNKNVIQYINLKLQGLNFLYVKNRGNNQETINEISITL